MNSDYNSRPKLKPKVPLSKTHKNECDPDNPKIPLHAGAEPRQFSYARDLRKQMTAAEKILWDCL